MDAEILQVVVDVRQTVESVEADFRGDSFVVDEIDAFSSEHLFDKMGCN